MRKYWWIVLFLSCTPTKTTIVNKGLILAVPIKTPEELTRRVIIDSINIEEIKKGFVFLGKSFKIDSLGNVSLADTIFINAIITNGRLYIGQIDTSHHSHGGGPDTLIDEPGHFRDKLKR